MRVKSRDIGLVKAGPADGLNEGEFTAYASVFGVKDSYGDVVEPGAFEDTLAAWRVKARPIPLLFGHNNKDPDYFIGQVVEAVEDDTGLLVRCQIDTSTEKGAQVHRLVKSGLLAEMSFMYSVKDGEYVAPVGEDGKKRWADEYFSLKAVDLYEVSVVHIGANPATEITDVKAAADAERVAERKGQGACDTCTCGKADPAEGDADRDAGEQTGAKAAEALAEYIYLGVKNA